MLRAYQFYSLLFDTTGARNHDLPALEAIMLTIKLPMRVCSKSKRRYNDLQNTTQETKDRETRSPLKNRDDISVIWRWTIINQSRIFLTLQWLKPYYTRIITGWSFTCGKHLHDIVISLRWEVWAHKTSLTPLLFIEVPAPRPEFGRSCICVIGLSISPLSKVLIFYFGIVPTMWYFRTWSVHFFIVFVLCGTSLICYSS